MEKQCIVCGKVKDIESFPPNRRMPDGHLGWCMDCFKKRGLPNVEVPLITPEAIKARKRKKYAKQRERASYKEYQHAYRRRPEVKEKYRQRNEAYRNRIKQEKDDLSRGAVDSQNSDS